MPKRKVTLEYCKSIAESRGGKCLSQKYVNSSTKMRWECGNGHRWNASYNAVSSAKKWCPYCAGKYKTIKDARELAKKNNGKCLSKKYVGCGAKMQWECENGHRWFSTYTSIGVGAWCRECKGIFKGTIERAQKIAKEKGGRCLSTKYKGYYGKLLFVCKNEHKWETAYANIKAGKWCQQCYGNTKKTIEDAIKLAKSMGGFCISKEYSNNSMMLEWQCCNGHIWRKRYEVVRKGYWCSFCSDKNSKQLKLLNYLKNIVGNTQIEYNFRGFDWLKTKNTGKQEIDIYVPSLKLAVEYDGKQHFKPVNFGGISDEEAEKNFKETVRLDKIKNKKIAKHPEDIKHFIRFNYKERLTERNVRSKLVAAGVIK